MSKSRIVRKINREDDVIEMDVVEHDALYQCVAELLNIHCQFGDRVNAIKYSKGLELVDNCVGLNHILSVLNRLVYKEKPKEKVVVNIEALSKLVRITAPTIKFLNLKEIKNRIKDDFESVFGDVKDLDFNISICDFLLDDNSEKEDLEQIIYDIENSLHVKFDILKDDFKHLSINQLTECLSLVQNRVNNLASPKSNSKTAKGKKKA